MKRAIALVLLTILCIGAPFAALAQTPNPGGDESPTPAPAKEPTERFVYGAVGLLFLLLFLLGVGYVKTVLRSAESR